MADLMCTTHKDYVIAPFDCPGCTHEALARMQTLAPHDAVDDLAETVAVPTICCCDEDVTEPDGSYIGTKGCMHDPPAPFSLKHDD